MIDSLANEDVIDLHFILSDLVDINLTEAEIFERASFDSLASAVIREHKGDNKMGHHAVDNKVHMHDLHATILHLMGLDHEKLTYQYAGRDFRLTDVAGNVVKEIIA